MSTLDLLHDAVHNRRADDLSVDTGPNRESLALILLDRITKAEGGEPAHGARAYTLDLLREILQTIDGKRNPPITLANVERRAG